MSEENKERRRRRNTGNRSGKKLRRFNNVESVIVEEPFALSVPTDTPTAIRTEVGMRDEDGNVAGDGYYVSATNGSSRYYGVLIEQQTLKAASLLHFHDEARSLELNRRMKILMDKRDAANKDPGANGDEPQPKRRKCEPAAVASVAMTNTKPIQKFRYQEPATTKSHDSDPGYRVLLATYANVEAACEGDQEKAALIDKACNAGGDWVGDYYYMYEISTNVLEGRKDVKITDFGLRASMGFQTFLHNTLLPVWFPLSNLALSQHKVLSMLQMKRNNKGTIVWDNEAQKESGNKGTHTPMAARSHFKVSVVGGGIAGLACATELLHLAEQDGIDIAVELFEARPRLGGRLLTDYTTFKFSDGSALPVDLGASWIHGIDHNPLAALAREGNIDFVTAPEEVRMIGENTKLVDKDVDDKMGQLFDKLLDQAADDVWDGESFVREKDRHQIANRWYAEALCGGKSHGKSDAPPHRHSSDITINTAIGKAIALHNHREFEKFGEDEHALLLWNTKNIEYALGANVCDLSMKYWDSDERHAFEGDHVLLRQGYSAVVNHMEKRLQKYGGKFAKHLNFPVGKVEYARRSESMSYPQNTRGRQNLLELSDVCCVSSRDESQNHYSDFVACTLPLGVLKESVSKIDSKSRVQFDPPLPFSKVDAIQNTGFGLLNKIYLQFSEAFWRIPSLLEIDQTQFGNASGINPHHYMFIDIGKSLGTQQDQPAILMTLVSGEEAAKREVMSDEEVVSEVLETLKSLFGNEIVSDPLGSRVTRWGTDEFSRGCYTFLPPGATDQDFQILQSPVNGNGDSLALEGSETMRLFWAGEHTTALHPSVAHGAMLSGIRAAKEIVSSIRFKFNEDNSKYERIIPLAIFRKKNPSMKLQCSLCHLTGSTVREGSLLAFQKGARQVLVHNNCGENSPEVEVRDGKWRHVIKAVNRGKQINCTMCGKVGATIGCTHDQCFKSLHFSCAQDTGWRFDRDGKVFFCELHRDYESHGENECDQISRLFYKMKHPTEEGLKCAFCHFVGDDVERRGKILVFQQKDRQLLVHDRCARYTNLLETIEDPTAMSDTDFKSLFEVLKMSKTCHYCNTPGATIVCNESNCNHTFHFCCAQDDGWDFVRRGLHFKCSHHRDGKRKATSPIKKTFEAAATAEDTAAPQPEGIPAGLFQHNLFFQGAKTLNGESMSRFSRSAKAENIAVNDEMGSNSIHHPPSPPADAPMREAESLPSSSSDDDNDENDEGECDTMDTCLTPQEQQEEAMTTIQLSRTSVSEPWNFTFSVEKYDKGDCVLILHVEKKDCPKELEGQKLLICAMNDVEVGGTLRTIRDAMNLIRENTDLSFQVRGDRK